MALIGLNTSGVSTDEVRLGASVFGVLRRYGKRTPASNKVWHANKLTGVYRDAIEFGGGSLIAAGGYVTTFGLVGGFLGVWFSRKGLLTMLRWGGAWDIATIAVMLSAFFCIALVGVYFEFFGPNEAPIYFDRARRKVYYVYRSKRRRFIFFGPSRIEARVVDWDLLDAECQTTMGGSTASVRQYQHLVFLMRTSTVDATIHGFYALRDLEFPNELWEFIRSYMEDGHAPLMADEAPPSARKVIKGSMIAAFFDRRHTYWHDWKTTPLSMFGLHLLLPFMLIWCVVNLFVRWTAQTVTWPAEVKPALGAPMTEADVAADTAHKLRAAPEAPTPAAQDKPHRGKKQ